MSFFVALYLVPKIHKILIATCIPSFRNLYFFRARVESKCGIVTNVKLLSSMHIFALLVLTLVATKSSFTLLALDPIDTALTAKHGESTTELSITLLIGIMTVIQDRN